MKNVGQIREEKIQHDINKGIIILALSSGRFDKHEYLTGDEILISVQSIMIKKLSLFILLSESLQENKQTQPKITKENKQMLPLIKTKNKWV